MVSFLQRHPFDINACKMALIFQVFNYDFVKYIYFSCIVTSSTVIGDVINYILYRTVLGACFTLKIDRKNLAKLAGFNRLNCNS